MYLYAGSYIEDQEARKAQTADRTILRTDCQMVRKWRKYSKIKQQSFFLSSLESLGARVVRSKGKDCHRQGLKGGRPASTRNDADIKPGMMAYISTSRQKAQLIPLSESFFAGGCERTRIYETHHMLRRPYKIAEIDRKVHFCRLPTTTHYAEQLSHPLAAGRVVKHLDGAISRRALAKANATVHGNSAAISELRICSCAPSACQTRHHHPYKRAELGHSFSLAT